MKDEEITLPLLNPITVSGWSNCSDSLPAPKEDWNHSEKCLVYYEAEGEGGNPASYGIAYYHYNPSFYDEPGWVDFSMRRGRQPQPVKWMFIPDLSPKSTGVGLIAAEREEQINKHGWSATHDDILETGQLASAAIACLLLDDCVRDSMDGYTYPPSIWPWDVDPWFWNIEKKDRIGQLAVAGALIAAEIDRLQRQKM